MTKNQLAFKKQQNRLKRAVKRLEKQGYFDFDFEIPERPQRVTKKSLEKIKAIKPKHIVKDAQHVDFETGWVRSAQEVIAEKKEIAKQKRKQTIERKKQKENGIVSISTIEMIERRLNQLADHPRFQNNIMGLKVRSLLNIFQQNINNDQDNSYYQYIKEHVDEIGEYSTVLEYSSGDSVEFDATLNTLIEILNGGKALSTSQALILGEMSDYI